MIKSIRNAKKAKLDEIIGKPPPFNPVTKGTKATHETDPNSPNVHEQMQRSSLGAKRKRATNPSKRVLGPLRKRTWLLDGQQSMKKGKRYTAEEEKKLGSTDTGQSGEDVDVNPKISTANGETTKNTTVKETKEK